MTVDLDNEPRPSGTARTPAPATGTGVVDGRHARSERSRQAMVDALLDLLRNGTLRPSSAQIAERAGVTQRTLFNQFGDMDSLISAVAARQSERVLSLAPSAGDGTLEERAARYCEGLAVLLDETMHIRWAVVTSTTEMAPAAAALGTARRFMRNLLTDAFARELDTLAEPVRAELLDALEIETDPVVWRMRRVQQDLQTDRARAVVERAVVALVRDAVREHERRRTD